MIDDLYGCEYKAILIHEDFICRDMRYICYRTLTLQGYNPNFLLLPEVLKFAIKLEDFLDSLGNLCFSIMAPIY
jgi:hypothetical protein